MQVTFGLVVTVFKRDTLNWRVFFVLVGSHLDIDYLLLMRAVYTAGGEIRDDALATTTRVSRREPVTTKYENLLRLLDLKHSLH